MNANVVGAIFKRNFLAYFNNPTGYVFICVFVALSSLAAFWPNDFFNSNLDNLDQLNKYLPFILLVFIPAITMSVWAEERRQGTDELLLTIPATDFDVVVGKYLAAVAIYSVSLLFSFVCNFLVLEFLGRPDLGLLLATYIGYWVVGLAMVSIGMVASFLTSNLTVSFVLGAAFNAPLVFMAMADVILPLSWAEALGSWSIGDQFRDFSRGVISLPSLAYFVSIIVVMLYLSMVLIGRRHWQGRDSSARGAIPSVLGWLLGWSVSLVISVAIMVLSAASFAGVGPLGRVLLTLLLSFVLLFPLRVLVLLLKLLAVARDVPPTRLQRAIVWPIAFALASLLFWLFYPRPWWDWPLSHVALAGLLALIIDVAYSPSSSLVKFALGKKMEMGQHFLLRAVAIVTALMGISTISDRSGLRADISQERLSSLAPQTRKLIRDMEPKTTINIDAYISPEVPESYVQTRLNLLSALREFKAIGSNKLNVQIHDTEPLSEEADRAEKLFGIQARQVFSRSRGAMKADDVYMGVAFTAGLNKVVVPFFDYGTPVEYELVRSITTVGQTKRKTVGVLATDAKLFGGFDQMSMNMTRNQPIIDELQKQYDVKQVSPDQPITEKYDVLLAVQPSSLSQEQMDNFITAVEHGQPTAIFEDPFPMDQSVPGTLAPKRPSQQGMFGGGRPQGGPKGDIGRLWADLGVGFDGDQVVWQHYNPYPRLDYLPNEFVFVDQGASADSDRKAFDPNDPISSGLQEMIFLFAGSITPLNATNLQTKELVLTGKKTGYVKVDELMTPGMFGGRGGLNPRREPHPTFKEYVLAVHVQGTLKDKNLPMSDKAPEAAAAPAAAKPDAAAAKPAERTVNVVLVSDIDVLYAEFFDLRNQAGDPNRGDVNLSPDNVTFVLNVLDSLAGDERFIEIRKRRPAHRTLERVETVTAGARQSALDLRAKYTKEFEEAKVQAQKDFDKEIKTIEDSNLDPRQMAIRLEMVRATAERRLQIKLDRLQKEMDLKVKSIDRELALEVRSVQNGYKMWAFLLPPIFPLLVGLAVFFNRRAGEREGVARSRLR